jgi:hypothetical protein
MHFSSRQEVFLIAREQNQREPYWQIHSGDKTYTITLERQRNNFDVVQHFLCVKSLDHEDKLLLSSEPCYCLLIILEQSLKIVPVCPCCLYNKYD